MQVRRMESHHQLVQAMGAGALDTVLTGSQRNTQVSDGNCADSAAPVTTPQNKASNGVVNPSEIRRGIEELGDWFHNIDLHGVTTAPNHFLGDYPALKWRHIAPAIPERLDGMSVLDIGCNAGFYSIELKRRGAARVLGIDADERYLAQGRYAARVLGIDIEFIRMSVYELIQLVNAGEQFDYVLFMGLFYHLRYPIYALDMIVKLVRRRLVFQTMIRGEEPATIKSDYNFWDNTPFRQSGFPCLYFFEQRYAGDPTNWLVPNRAAVEGILRSAGLRLLSHPEAETWICEPDGEQVLGGYVFDRELAGTL